VVKQLSIFQTNNLPKKEINKEIINLACDGASRNNPGPSSAGIVIWQDNKEIAAKGFFLGKKTNNQSEYLALILGILCAKKVLKPDQLLNIVSDSKLLVHQILGLYKIKHENLKILHKTAISLLHKIDYRISHVLRDQNKRADELANEAIDKRLSVPKEFLDLLLHEYNIEI